ncbi:MAG: class I SAM-dependent methyltransferase, partial [Candidatus Kapaibacterium sp.]
MENNELKNLPLLQGRCKLAYEWIPENTEKLLDAGCSTGYCTVHYARKSNETYGIDIVAAQIQEAKSNFPHINFQTSALEEIPFDDGYFDTVICTDVLEHTNDKIKSLTELFRVLKSGGTLVLSVPHKGKYQYLDPYNYGFYMRKHLKPLYLLLYKLAWLFKGKKWPPELNPEHNIMHHHYDSDDLISMMNNAGYRNKYKI